jgi:Bacterial SH3 domain
VNRGKRKTFITVALIVASVIAALLVELITGTSGGATTPSGSGSTSAAPHAVTTAGPRGTSSVPANANSAGLGPGNYRTVGTSVNLRAGAATNSAVITVMRDLGSPVTLSCYLRGSSIGGDPWWYRATYGSARGYVAGFWVNTGPDPAKTHLPAC